MQAMTGTNRYKPPGIVLFYRWLWKFWKDRRFQRFVEAIHPSSDCSILDIGGYPVDWYARGDVIGKVDVLNLELAALHEVPHGAPEIRSLAGDACRLGIPSK